MAGEEGSTYAPITSSPKTSLRLTTANVVKELKWLKDNYRPDHIWFADDIFGLKPGWIERFSELAVAEDALIPFKCLQQVDLVSEKVAQALKAADCRTGTQFLWTNT
jgi:radical SAM superfamily enzyme YgiQ (UPF0313 family)